MDPERATQTPRYWPVNVPSAHDEYELLKAFRAFVDACNGRAKIAEGIAIDLIRQETEYHQ